MADDFGKQGRAWREADYETTDLETVIQDLMSGQYSGPIRVVAFNTAERWSQDVSEDVAHELRRRCDVELRDVPFYLQDCTDKYEGRSRRPAASTAAVSLMLTDDEVAVLRNLGYGNRRG